MTNLEIVSELTSKFLALNPNLSPIQLAEKIIKTNRLTCSNPTCLTYVRQAMKDKKSHKKEADQGLIVSDDEMVQKIKNLLKNAKEVLSIGQICDKFDISPKRVIDSIKQLKEFGFNFEIKGDVVYKTEGIPKGKDFVLDVVGMSEGTYRFGALGDNHLCSKYERLDVLNALYDLYEKEGIKTVYNTGNWIDGEARFNKHDLHTHGIDNQLRYMIKNYPKKDGITTYYIGGDDHEGWYCFDNLAEIMTQKRGWVKFEELKEEDLVATMTESGEFQWQKTNKIVSYPYEGEMIHVKTRSLDFKVTPEHRLLMEKRPSLHGKPEEVVVTAKELYDNFKSRCYRVVCSSKSWAGELTPFVEIPAYESTRYKKHPKIQRFGPQSIYDIAELIGWYVSEGHGNEGGFGIAQSLEKNPENHKQISKLLKRIGARYHEGKMGFRVCSPQLGRFLVTECGRGSANKKLPEWIKNQPQEILRIVLDAMVKGDGTFKSYGYRYWSWSKTLRDDFCEIAQKLGLSTLENSDSNSVSARGKYIDPWLGDLPEKVDYKGMVYCVSVPNERIYVRSNGKAFWSMNCQREGIDVGKYLQFLAGENGREDLVYIGHMEADVIIKAPKGQTKIRILHPGGGSSYATSYSVQKIVESYQGGEKPDILLVGHYHKAEYTYVRGVHSVQTGTTQDQSPFMRKKKLAAHLGGWIIEFSVDKNGAVTRFKQEFIPFYDKKYYKDNKWEYKW